MLGMFPTAPINNTVARRTAPFDFSFVLGATDVALVCEAAPFDFEFALDAAPAAPLTSTEAPFDFEFLLSATDLKLTPPPDWFANVGVGGGDCSRNIDGGHASSVYTSDQRIDGGQADSWP